jgi:hypothetical protein
MSRACLLMVTLTLLAITASSTPAAAQQALVPRPDTMGANFDAASPGTGTPADYDFLIGRWTYRFQFRDPASGAYSPVRQGTWTATKRPDGPFVADEFSATSPDSARSQGTVLTYRAFNPARKRWDMQGVGSRRGRWSPGVSWSDGGDRFVVQEDSARGVRVRIRYYAITPNHFLWRADGSRDGGRTWLRDVMLIEATRLPDR